MKAQNKLVLTFSLFLSIVRLTAQEQVTIGGYVRDESNGEALIGATVYVNEISNGTITNVYGYYAITLPKGEYSISYRYVGYEAKSHTVELQSNSQFDVELSMMSEQLEAVVIASKAEDANVSTTEMSTVSLDIQSIKSMPAFAGEVDVIKSIQMLPGVTSVGEGAPGFNVRGGTVGQNLVLLDEAPVYQSSHMFGFFSVFNPDAVKDVKLYKGGIPAKYGGRLSSVLDIRMKEGNNKRYEVNGGIGTVFSRLSVEGPLKKDKASFILAARRSYADVFAKALTDMLEDGGLYFYDLTAKVNLNINEKNRVFASGYWGRDVFDFGETTGFDWGNRTATLRWNNLISQNLFSNYSLYYSLYDYGFSFGDSRDSFDWKSSIETFNFKPEYAWSINPTNELTFGGEAILYGFKPAVAEVINGGVTTEIDLGEKRALESSVYASNSQDFGSKLSVEYGMRWSQFMRLGGFRYHYGDTVAGIEKPLIAIQKVVDGKASDYTNNLEPRFSAKYQLSTNSSVKASYNRTIQYLHQISNINVSTPTDIWYPSNNNVLPQKGQQVALGYFKNIDGNAWEASLEGYYKWTSNQVDYIDGADLFVNEYLDAQLLSGIGRSYGLEFYLRKNTGRLTGWVSYTLGKSEIKVDGINYGSDLVNRTGKWYATSFDQRHNLKVAAFYDLSDKYSLSTNFSFMSGTPATFPTDRMTVNGYVIPYIKGGSRNNFRAPDYHRLDLSVTIKQLGKPNKKKSINDQLVVSVYNVYARENPFSIYFSQGTERQGATNVETTAKQMSMLGTLIPAISYNFKF
ncbi:TonB-dependent receptor [Marinoscillum pacificum]|uniref:TonB-dependent receptor n=1 Tax=Marinoscillum pacificum TaxID=392723 RepID=UPI0021578BAE|nr:TonB-dependent receptor [Marinoscillum pacificum]